MKRSPQTRAFRQSLLSSALGLDHRRPRALAVASFVCLPCHQGEYRGGPWKVCSPCKELYRFVTAQSDEALRSQNVCNRVDQLFGHEDLTKDGCPSVANKRLFRVARRNHEWDT